MAQNRTFQVGAFFASGASLGAYKRSNWAASQLPPTGAPVGSADTSGTVAADTTLTLLGLADDTDYFVTDSSGSRYLSVRATSSAGTTPALDAAGHFSLTTGQPYGLAIGRGGCNVPVGLHTHGSAGNISNGTDTAANFEIFIPLTDPTVGEILPVFGNWQGASDILTGLVDLPLACAVKCSDGTILPFTFGGGLHTGTLKLGSMLIPDAPLAFGDQITKTLVTGDVCKGVWIRVFVGPITAGGKWPLQNDGRLITGGSGELALSGAAGLSQTDLTPTGSGALTGGTNGNALAPILVLGNAKVRKPIVALVGDSQIEGANDLPLTYGYVERTLLKLGYPMVKIAKGGESATNFATMSGRKYRMALLDGCTHAICNYGTNDLVGNGRTVAQLQADNLTIATYLANLGMKVYQTTLTPRTTSTDTWATTVNQTANGSAGTTDPVRLAGYNGWLRDGAPIDATSKAAVAIGTTSNVLRYGGVGHPLTGYIDMNSVVDNGVDTGLWKGGTSPNDYTNDGTHMHNIGLTLSATYLQSALAAWSV